LTLPELTISQNFDRHRKVLWDLSYRMTGSAADADDVVQETFVRALSHPPPRTDDPLLPWLVRVVLNASRDLLRRRRRREYTGPWLPQPIELGGEHAAAGAQLSESADARYDLLESASFAFLLALEALSARQRAVLLLRDVFDYSVRETAAALAVSEGAVKTAHHRARRCMQDYDRRRVPTAPEQNARNQRALAELMTAIIARDVTRVEALLAGDARLLTDGGGEFLAALKPIQGPQKIARGLVALARTGSAISAEMRWINGMPGVVLSDGAAPPRHAPRLLLGVESNASGRIEAVYVVLTPQKLGAVRFP
jgi:RNA polymerase sigma-70 factor (ECF subfamily)